MLVQIVFLVFLRERNVDGYVLRVPLFIRARHFSFKKSKQQNQELAGYLLQVSHHLFADGFPHGQVLFNVVPIVVGVVPLIILIHLAAPLTVAPRKESEKKKERKSFLKEKSRSI